MRRLTVSLLALSLLGLPGLAAAQSLRQKCDAKKSEIESLKGQATQMENELNAKAVKIEKVRKRLQLLEAERLNQARARGDVLNRIKAEEAAMARMCKPLDRCGALDARADNLEKKLSPEYAQLRAIRDEIRREVQQIGALNNDVNRIQNQYNQLNCDDLVPGKTAQATIDQCNKLFSDWNAAAARINQLETNVKNLRVRYQKEMGLVQALNREIARLRDEMRTNCSDSQKYASLEAMDKERAEYEGMKAELDDADKQTSQLKAVQIGKGRKGPRLKKAP